MARLTGPRADRLAPVSPKYFNNYFDYYMATTVSGYVDELVLALVPPHSLQPIHLSVSQSSRQNEK